jgi:NAD(P)H-hydrate epimerase
LLLLLYRYSVTVVYPKPSKGPLFDALARQCRGLGIPVLASLELCPGGFEAFDCAVDAIFGFSFHGAPRPPFDGILAHLATRSRDGTLPVLSVDVPSGWHVERGDLTAGGDGLHPQALVSLTAPKQCALHFTGRHFLGGRFVPPAVVEKYALKLPAYPGTAQVVELADWGENLKAVG